MHKKDGGRPPRALSQDARHHSPRAYMRAMREAPYEANRYPLSVPRRVGRRGASLPQPPTKRVRETNARTRPPLARSTKHLYHSHRICRPWCRVHFRTREKQRTRVDISRLVLVSSSLLLGSEVEGLASLDSELGLLLANLALHTKDDLLRGFGLLRRKYKL